MKTGKSKDGGKGSKKGKAIKKKAKKDPNEPPKPVSAYASFFRDTQAAIKSQNPDATFGEVSKIVASMWDSLDLEKKNDYKERADAAKKEYLQILAAYRASKSAIESPDVMELNEDEEMAGGTSPVPVPSADSSSPEIIKTITVTKSDASNLVEEENAEDDNEIEFIDPSKEETEVMEECENAPVSSETEVTENATKTESVQENEQNNPKDMNGISIIEPSVQICIRNGCNNPAIDSPEWDKEYCSSECVVEHCSVVFMTHVTARQKKAEEIKA